VGRRWVMNASPVILLAKAKVIHLVPQICEQLVVPAGTVQEVERGKLSDAGRAWLASEGARFVHQPGRIPERVAHLGLGLGETQVLAWLLEQPGFEGVLDDLKARRCATQLNVPVIGSLRVLIVMKEQRLIPAIRPAVDRFHEAGSYVSQALVQEALRIAGEAQTNP
jgi:predicted nucleic acid-binding protein